MADPDAIVDGEHGQQKYFFLGSSGFSIFDTMSALLLERGDWEREPNPVKAPQCALILGDRFDIPYDRLRAEAALVRGQKPLVNYFKGSHRLTLKASMAKLLRDAVPHIREYMPLSFVLGTGPPKPATRFKPATQVTDERDAFLLEQTNAEGSDRIWIVKPSAGCKGAGITLWRTAAEAIAFVDQQNAGNSSGQVGLYAAQEYIRNPLLLDGNRKFDVRVWALVVPPYDIYIYNQGSCRTASLAYDPDDLSNAMMHLTNHGLQQDSEDFGSFEEGNEMWYSAFDAVLRRRFGEDKSFDAVVRPQIQRIVVDTLYAAKELIEVGDHERFNCFQLFGFDLMLDDQLKLHLIEINGSPGAADRWLAPLVNSMIDVAVDPRFPPLHPEPTSGATRIQQRIADLGKTDGEHGAWQCVWRATDKEPFTPIARSQPVDESADVVVVARGGPRTSRV